MFLKGHLAYFQVLHPSRCYSNLLFTVDDYGLWCWPRCQLCIPPGGAYGGADKMHALMKRLAQVGAARPPGKALLNLAFPGTTGGRQTCVQERVTTSCSFSEIRRVFHFVKTLLKRLIVANVADYWGVLLFAEYAAHMPKKPEVDDKGGEWHIFAHEESK